MGQAARKPAKSSVEKTSKPAPEPAVSHEEKLLDVKVADLHPGLAQYRRHFDEERTRALAENMARLGQLDRLVIRKRSKGGFEIVSGERRWRAAKIVKMPKLRCSLRELTDEQAYEVAIAGNTQREDPHPLEECDGFVVLHDTYKRTAEQIAAKVNRPVGYVYDRLALRDLGDAARKAMLDGRLGLGVARMLSRVRPHTLQAEAVKELVRDRADDDPITVSEARRIVGERYMLRLATAPFDPGDVGLTKAGSCHACPKNSATQGKLFGDALGKGDLCTDRVCWEMKVGTDAQQRLARAKSEGKAVMPTPDVAKVFPYGDHVSDRAWLDLDSPAVPHSDSSRTWRSVIGKSRLGSVQITLAKLTSGKVLELVRRATVESVMRRAPMATDPKLFADAPTPAQTARDKADRAKIKRDADTRHLAEKKIRDATIAAVEVAVGRGDFIMIFRKLAQLALDDAEAARIGMLDDVCERRGIAVDRGDKDEQAIDVLLATVDEYSAEQCVGLLAELLTHGRAFRVNPLEDLAAYLLVDVDHHTREAKREIEEKAAPGHVTKLRGRKRKTDDTAPGKHDPIAEPAGDDGEDW